MYDIKICDMTHLEQAVAMTRLKEKHGGLQANWMADWNTIFKKYLGPSPYYMLLGAFEGDKLVSFLGLAFYNKSDPAWFIVFMFTTVFNNKFSFNRPDIGPLVKTAFEIAERRHYWNYYYSLAKKHELLYDRLWSKNQYMPTGRYETRIEVEIPPYTPMERDRYWRLMGQRVHDVDVVIKRRILRHEFRREHASLHPVELSSHKEYTNVTQLPFDSL